MRRTIVIAAAFSVALVSGGATPAGAQPAPGCAPSDLGCALVEGLEGALAPIVQPQGPAGTAPPGTSPSTTAMAGLGPGPVTGSAGDATPAELAAEPVRIPAVPVGEALELPPLSVPDFGPAGGTEAAPVARSPRPLRSEVGDALTGLATPPPAPAVDRVRAAALALGAPTVLVAVSLLARRRAARARTGAPAIG